MVITLKLSKQNLCMLQCPLSPLWDNKQQTLTSEQAEVSHRRTGAESLIPRAHKGTCQAHLGGTVDPRRSARSRSLEEAERPRLQGSNEDIIKHLSCARFSTGDYWECKIQPEMLSFFKDQTSLSHDCCSTNTIYLSFLPLTETDLSNTK